MDLSIKRVSSIYAMEICPFFPRQVCNTLCILVKNLYVLKINHLVENRIERDLSILGIFSDLYQSEGSNMP